VPLALSGGYGAIFTPTKKVAEGAAAKIAVIVLAMLYSVAAFWRAL